MFISDALVYVELQKTGSTHIAALLSRFLDGKRKGKHRRPTWELRQSQRTFVSSIRNPWEWYLSLWTYGCDGGGGLRERLLDRESALLWRQCYSDASNPELFRDWLRTLHDPGVSKELGEGYGRSRISALAGFYTHRYFRLCCRNLAALDNNVPSSVEDLCQFDEMNCFISKWIRTESLECDFIRVLKESGQRLSCRDEEKIRSLKKTNTSSRKHPTSYYYDDEAIRSVANKEALIINKFGYSFPHDGRSLS